MGWPAPLLLSLQLTVHSGSRHSGHDILWDSFKADGVSVHHEFSVLVCLLGWLIGLGGKSELKRYLPGRGFGLRNGRSMVLLQIVVYIPGGWSARRACEHQKQNKLSILHLNRHLRPLAKYEKYSAFIKSESVEA